jgi:hypothetical protein
MILSLSGLHSCLYLPTNLTRKMLLHEPHQKVSNDNTLEAPGNKLLRLLLVTSLFFGYLSGYFDICKPH